MFCKALQPLLTSHQDQLQQLDEILNSFSKVMQMQMEKMWTEKLGLKTFDAMLFTELQTLMAQTPVDYTLFFRELSTVPDDITPLKKSFYRHSTSQELDQRWSEWLIKWRLLINSSTNTQEQVSKQMKLVNPKYSLREWFVVPAYQQAAQREYSLVRKLQEVMTQPYAEQTSDVEEKYYQLKPPELFDVGGMCYYSCSS
jgi:uncharacterized protein YdiU (UPF0061 family)